MSTKVTVAPAREPVTLAEAKDHLNLTHDLDDSIIEPVIKAAREMVESITGRALITQTLEHRRDQFDDEMCLLYPPLQSVSNIAYVDTDGASQTLATSIYEVDARHEPGRVVLAYDQSWPSTRVKINAVTITYIAGYGNNAEDVPASIRAAMLLIIGHLYENRENTSPLTITELPMGVRWLLAPYRIIEF